MPKLTKTAVDNAKAPATGDAWLWDSELEGFGVRIQASGRKTYVVRYRTRDAERKQRKLTLARCSDMAPEKARELARKTFSQVAEGKDPAAERKPAVAAPSKTVERMFEGYVASMRTNGRESADEVERALLLAKANAADALGRHKPAADVTPTDIANYIATFFNAGHRGAADKHRGYISSAYNWAMKSANDYTVPADKRVDFGITSNPVAAVPKDQGAKTTRERNLLASELRQLWLATDPINNIGRWEETAACIRLLICCGQRVRETLRITGKDIDLEERVWRMPAKASKTGKKSGKGHVVPLPKQAIPILQSLIDQHGDGPLFPARYGAAGETMADESIMQAINRWLSRDDVHMEPFQTRDLRRTWKSRSHDAGIDRFYRDLIQQHSMNDTGSKHYDYAEYLPQMREAMAKWERYLETITSPQEVIKIAA